MLSAILILCASAEVIFSSSALPTKIIPGCACGECRCDVCTCYPGKPDGINGTTEDRIGRPEQYLTPANALAPGFTPEVSQAIYIAPDHFTRTLTKAQAYVPPVSPAAKWNVPRQPVMAQSNCANGQCGPRQKTYSSPTAKPNYFGRRY